MSSMSRRRFLQASGPLAAMSAMTRGAATAPADARADTGALPRVRQEAGRTALCSGTHPGRVRRPQDRRGRAGGQRSQARHRRRRNRDSCAHLQRFDSGTPDHLPRGRLHRAHPEESGREPTLAQYRLPRIHRCSRRRRPDTRSAGRAGCVAMEGNQAGHVHLSLRTGRLHDSIPRGLGNERGRHGAAQDRPQGRQRQAHPATTRLTTSASRTFTCREMQTAIS